MSYSGFRIICLGTYCLPRVLATVTNFKATKAQGEKTCPFDLGFFWNFDKILNNLDNEFANFFDNIEYGYIQNDLVKEQISAIFTSKLNAKYWKDDKSAFIFNHEDGFTFDELKLRYKNRIENFYEYIKNNDIELYFLISTFNTITNEQITKLNNIIKRYRKQDSFYNIILNQSDNKPEGNIDNTHIINCSEFNRLFAGNWSVMLKEHSKYQLADNFYKMASNEFKKIVLRLNMSENL